MTTARALAHRLGAHRKIVLARGVAHRPLRVVHRTGHLTDERNGHVVGHLIHRRVAPLHLFKPVHTLEVHDIRVGALESGRLVGTVEVHQQVVFGAHLGRPAEPVGHRLVVAIHEIHLEALDAHLGVVSADILHILRKRPPASPEDDAHTAPGGIRNQFGEVNLRHLQHEVVGIFHCPSLVENHILDAVLRSEVDVVAVGFVIDAGLEIHTLQVPRVPPFPGDLTGPYPRPVGV